MDIRHIKASDIMKSEVVKVFPETTLHQLAKVLQENRISGVPVVDHSNKLLGVVSQTDIIRFYATFPLTRKGIHPYFKTDEKTGASEEASVLKDAIDDFGEHRVDEIMNKETFAFQETVSVSKIAKAMTEMHMHRVIIVDEDLNLSGIISSLDFVRLIGELDRE